MKVAATNEVCLRRNEMKGDRREIIVWSRTTWSRPIFMRHVINFLSFKIEKYGYILCEN